MNKPAEDAMKCIGRIFDAAVARERKKQERYKKECGNE
jgi:hypothetical protein